MNWLDVEDLAEGLLETHPARDPLRVRFTELRALVEALPEFERDDDHHVNEKILEAIQGEWYRLKAGLPKSED